ncbi:hypothetical protein JYU34_004270 [Plutella xylostella]|uniref:C2H2-type domain-containing protein n=2 Tax=Plutella xylostella TaxID=51655 RepID=A0ABQ7QXJ4_PLUXY|nr:hypothetical protein JYU34_004270 [Plutella xylostella]
MMHKKSSEPIQCPTCQQEFNTERRLRCHVQQVHEKVRPFKCGHCDYTAARKEELKLHLRSHTGDKPYSCEHCSYRSGDHNAMRRHKKTHSKESLYRCKHCPYSAIQSTTFASHMISKHPHVTSSDVHRCPYCPFKTVKKEKYVVHLTSHPDKEGVKLLIEMSKGVSKPSWTIPSENTEAVAADSVVSDASEGTKKAVNDIPIEVYDCDSQQDGLTQKYPKSYSTHAANDNQNVEFSNTVVTDSNKQDDNNSDCLIESSCDYAAPHCLQPPYEPPPDLRFLTTAVSLEQNILQSAPPRPAPLAPGPARPGIMTNFPIRLPPLPPMSVRNHITLKPVDKIFPMTKVTGPIIKPTQILPVPSSSNSPVSMTTSEPEGGPRKKPKISVKSNMILKGPDSANMFHSQQKMAFKRLEDNERFGLGPVTFNNLITTQFMQLPPEPTLSESPSLAYQEPLQATPPADAAMGDSAQLFTFSQQLAGPALLPPRPKLPPTDPSYIKLEGAIKQNTQSPSLERMCSANIQNITREYKASPPLEDIHKNMSEIKNEVKSDYYSIPMNTAATNQPMMDQYLIDNIIGEQYVSGHLDLSNIALPLVEEDQQNDVIEIDDNSDDTKLLQRFDMNFPMESMYLMHNDFHFLDNDMPSNNVSEAPVNEMNRMVAEVPIVNQKEGCSEAAEAAGSDFPNFIQGKKDPMMNTSVRPSTNKINVKNIELMKN